MTKETRKIPITDSSNYMGIQNDKLSIDRDLEIDSIKEFEGTIFYKRKLSTTIKMKAIIWSPQQHRQ
jgi:hypothetical protein